MKSLTRTLLFCFLFILLVVGLMGLSGCGHEAKRTARFETDTLIVETLAKGSSTNSASTNTSIVIISEPNGLQRFTYNSDTSSDSTGSHDPADTIEAVGNTVGAAGNALITGGD